MPQRMSMIALLGTLSLTACGSDPVAAGTSGAAGTAAGTSVAGAAGMSMEGTGGAAGSGGAAGTGGTAGTVDAAADAGPAVDPPCGIGENGICAPKGLPYAVWTFAHSNSCMGICAATPNIYGIGKPPADGAMIRLSQPESGTLCLSGTAPDAGLLLGFTLFSSEMLSPDYQKVYNDTFFNAQRLGITQFRFTIDTPPPAGVKVSVNTIHSFECNANDCLWGFTSPSPITEPGKTTTVSFGDFISNAGHVFDARAIHSIGFDWGAGAFDFCVRNFQLLDASGAEVKP